jgi:hypothetical protein
LLSLRCSFSGSSFSFLALRRAAKNDAQQFASDRTIASAQIQCAIAVVVGFLCTDSAADARISLNFCCCSHGLLEHGKPLVTRVITCCEDLEELQRLCVLVTAILSAIFLDRKLRFSAFALLKFRLLYGINILMLRRDVEM